MPACEKCWHEAGIRAAVGVRDKVDIYRELVESRDCTPEEQCGEMHLVLDWKDGSKKCRCGKVVEKEADE